VVCFEERIGQVVILIAQAARAGNRGDDIMAV
jgi:hypothetical protein